jgi:DNA-damage-inducible protein J
MELWSVAVASGIKELWSVAVATGLNVAIRLDKKLKEQAERMFTDFGMKLSTAFNIFARQSLRHGKIPFEIFNPFYSVKNQTELSRRNADVETGKATFVVKTMEELEAMADE